MALLNPPLKMEVLGDHDPAREAGSGNAWRGCMKKTFADNFVRSGSRVLLAADTCGCYQARHKLLVKDIQSLSSQT